MAATPSARMPTAIRSYLFKVVERELPAINYFHRSGSTKVGMKGTELMPGAKGEAEGQ